MLWLFKKQYLTIVDTIGTVDDLIEELNLKFNKVVEISQSIFNKYENMSVERFSNVFSTFNGGTFKSKDYSDKTKNKLITIKNVDDNGFNALQTSFLKDNKIDCKYLLKIGDIILTMTGNIGRVGIVDEENCYQNQRILKLLCCSQLYLFCYLSKYKKEIIQLGKGTAQLNLSLKDLNNLYVNNSIDEINVFSKNDIIFDELVNIKLQISKLKKIKSLLLKKYF